MDKWDISMHVFQFKFFYGSFALMDDQYDTFVVASTL